MTSCGPTPDQGVYVFRKLFSQALYEGFAMQEFESFVIPKRYCIGVERHHFAVNGECRGRPVNLVILFGEHAGVTRFSRAISLVDQLELGPSFVFRSVSC